MAKPPSSQHSLIAARSAGIGTKKEALLRPTLYVGDLRKLVGS